MLIRNWSRAGWSVDAMPRMPQSSLVTWLSRLANRAQLTTDGHKAYLEAVWNAFGNDIDYAMLEKIYNNPPTGAQTRFSPGVCCGAKKKKITGGPERNKVSTSFVKRQNLTMIMSMRRFTRLTIMPSPRKWKTLNMP